MTDWPARLPSPNVTIGVHGRFWAFRLAEGLQQAGLLQQLITTYPAPVVRKFFPIEAQLTTAPLFELWRRAYSRCAFLPNPTPGLLERFGRHVAASLSEETTLFHGWSSVSLEALGVARARGMRRVVDRGSAHIVSQKSILSEAYARHDLSTNPINPKVIERECGEYELADRICVPTTYSAETFIQHGIPREKLWVNAYGADTSQYIKSDRRSRGRLSKPIILFAGEVGIRKGIPELLQAFRPLKSKAKLWIAGPVEPVAQAAISRQSQEGVTFLGPLTRPQLIRKYHEADIFCLPSWEEGYGMVLLEALATGLPIVASRVSGAADLVVNSDTGHLVTPGDVPALTMALERLIDAAPEERHEMGEIGATRVQNEFGWDRYMDRALALYAEMME